MRWLELKSKVESLGVEDSSPIAYLDITCDDLDERPVEVFWDDDGVCIRTECDAREYTASQYRAKAIYARGILAKFQEMCAPEILQEIERERIARFDRLAEQLEKLSPA